MPAPSRSNPLRLLASLLAAAILSLVIAPSVSATAATPEAAGPVVAKSAISPLAAYVTFSSTGYRLNAPESVLQQVPQDQLKAVQSYLADVNAHIAKGDLVMRPDGTATQAGQLRTTSSHGYITVHWWGIEVGLDPWLTNKVEGGAWVGAGVSALAALLGGGPYAGAVAAVLTVAAGAIQVCTHQDGWTYLYWIGALPPAGSFVCNPFG